MMMKILYIFMNNRSAAIRRLKIISGQVNGLVQLLEQENDCEKIFPQVKAVKNAFSGFSAEIMMNMIDECLAEDGEKKKIQPLVKYFTQL